MAPARRQATTFCVALITCAATVTSVTWLSALAAHHHEGGPDDDLLSRHLYMHCFARVLFRVH